MPTETLRPNAPGDECNIITQSGCSACDNHYDCVDEVVADTTTYVRNYLFAFQRDLYNIDDSAVGAGTINHIKVYARCKLTFDITYNSLKIAIKSGTGSGAPDTIDESSVILLNNVWTTYSNQWNTNPATAAPWTWDEIDKLQAGISILAPGGGVDVYCTQVYVEVDYTEIVATNMEVNIADVFKDISEIKINIGGVWKDVAGIKINIGDVWKDVF